MLAAIPNNPLGLLSDTAPNGRRTNATPDDPFVAELSTLRRDLGTLAAICAEALSKTAQHYHGEDSWVIGTMPGYGSLADSVEANARGFLANSHLSSHQAEVVANSLKMSGDLRTAARGARQAVQLAFLLQQERSGGAEALQLLTTIADAAASVAQSTADALQNGDSNAAHQAAQLFRQVDSLRFQIEAGLFVGTWHGYFTPTLAKMVRAAAWNFAVSGEGMARVSARLLVPG